MDLKGNKNYYESQEKEVKWAIDHKWMRGVSAGDQGPGA